jgi:hypothetical protein
VSHRKTRLTFHGRRLLVQRVRVEGVPVAHVAKAMEISQFAHRWLPASTRKARPVCTIATHARIRCRRVPVPRSNNE